MSLISSNFKQRCRSSYEKRREEDEKAILINYNGEIRLSRMNIKKYTENSGIADSFKEYEYDTDFRGREGSRNMFTTSNEPLKIDPSNKLNFPYKHIPYKLDQKLYQRLKQVGYKVPVDLKDENPKPPLQEYLKIASVQINTLIGTGKPRTNNDKMNMFNFRNNRSYSRNRMTNNSISFETQAIQPSELKQGYGVVENDKKEYEKKEKEAIKKGIYGNNPNFTLNQLTLFTTKGNYSDQIKQKAKMLKPSYESDTRPSDAKYIVKQSSKGLGSPLIENLLSKDSDQICEDPDDFVIFKTNSSFQRGNRDEKKEFQKVSPFSSQKFGHLQQIEEISKKKNSNNTPVIPIINSIIQNRLLFEQNQNGNSVSPMKDEKASDIGVQSIPGQVSSRESISNKSPQKNKLQNMPHVKITKGQTPFLASRSLEPPDISTREKPNTPTNGNAVYDYNASYKNAFASPYIAQTNLNNLQNIQAIHSYNISNIGITGTKVASKSPPRLLNSINTSKVQPQNIFNKNQNQNQAGNNKTKQNNIPSNVNKQDQSRVSFNSSSPIKPQVGTNKALNAMNKNEEISKRRSQTTPPPSTFKYYVGRGNNSLLIKKMFKLRNWWEETPIYDQAYNMKWQQTYRGFRYERLIGNPNLKQLVNHFEYHGEISTKNGLIRSLSSYCEAHKIHLSDLTPTTFVFNMDDEVNFDTDMQRFSRFFIKNYSDSNFYPKPDPNDKKNVDVWYNFDYRRRGKHSPPNLAIEKPGSAYLKPKMHNTFLKGFNVWVIKPTGLNRGRGIEVFNSLESLNEIMNQYFSRVPNLRQRKEEGSEKESSEESEEEPEDKKKRGPVIKSRTFVIQKYIESLMLVNNRKFDIRVWVLVTHEMQLYFFKEGYLRTCSEVYTLDEDHILDKFVHLTNNAIQRYGENYGNHENGNQLSFQDLEKYVEANNINMDFRGKVLPRMKELTSISMQSVKKTLNLNERKHCFEVFGYDFMIDSEYNVWLIEVNTNPCLDESSPLLKQLLPRMIDDAFKLTVDVVFPRPVQQKNELALSNLKASKHRKISEDEMDSVSSVESETIVEDKKSQENPPKKVFHVDGYDDEENMWEYLCSIQYQKPLPKKDANRHKQVS